MRAGTDRSGERRAARRRSLLWLGVFLAISFVPSVIAAVTVGGAGEFYRELRRPDWSPPSWVFGPVWTVLYVLMGVAAWLVWRCRRERQVGAALAVWGVQLALNAAWSPVFFGMGEIGWAFWLLVALWWAVAATMVLFALVRPWTPWLLLPYLAWLTFAGVLNYNLWLHNPPVSPAVLGGG